MSKCNSSQGFLFIFMIQGWLRLIGESPFSNCDSSLWLHFEFIPTNLGIRFGYWQKALTHRNRLIKTGKCKTVRRTKEWKKGNHTQGQHQRWKQSPGFCVSVTSISMTMQENPRLLQLYFSTSGKKETNLKLNGSQACARLPGTVTWMISPSGGSVLILLKGMQSPEGPAGIEQFILHKFPSALCFMVV